MRLELNILALEYDLRTEDGELSRQLPVGDHGLRFAGTPDEVFDALKQTILDAAKADVASNIIGERKAVERAKEREAVLTAMQAELEEL